MPFGFYGFYGLDGRIMILLLVAFAFSMYAQIKVQSAFARFSKIAARSGLTGAQVARELLDQNGMRDVPVELVPGRLNDHYDPRRRRMRLSPDVYHGNSLAALGVAAHEAGHAVQHGTGYAPLSFRNSLFPVANLGSTLAMPIFLIGLIFGGTSSLLLMNLGIILFSVAVAFQIITLPVEFNASSRALAMLETSGALGRGEELEGARKVLNAAALTYLAATAVALLTLLRLFLLRESRRD
ncbi:MAG: zinc metallopeptidase [Patescibacteria group bacterium]